MCRKFDNKIEKDSGSCATDRTAISEQETAEYAETKRRLCRIILIVIPNIKSGGIGHGRF